ncbi:C1 family peptidase [Elusimicrobiota bacterium]
MRRFLRFKFFILIIFLFSAGSTAFADTVHRGGFRKPTEKEQEYLKDKVLTVTEVKPNILAKQRFMAAPSIKYGLAASVTNWLYLPPVGNQGSQGSCSAWACCYYMKTYQEAKENGWSQPLDNDHAMSPAFGYNLANDGVDSGSAPELINQIMVDHGCPLYSDMPYSEADFISWPSETAWKNGIPQKCESSAKIDLSDAAGIDALKQHVANGNLAVIGVEIDNYFDNYPGGGGDNNNVLHSTTTVGVRGGHAITIIGYDDTKTYNDGVPSSGAFLAVNQWGSNWGIKELNVDTSGFILLSYKYVRDLSYQEAYIITDKIGYTSDTFGKFWIEHNKRGDLNVFFMGGDSKYAPDWSFNCLPNLGGPKRHNDVIVVDLAPYSPDFDKKFWLKVGDLNPQTDTGQIHSMAVEKVPGGVATSADVPKNTINSAYVYVELVYIVESPDALQNVVSYPNPAYFGASGGSVTFGSIPLYSTEVTIFIYNVAGDLVRILDENSEIIPQGDFKVGSWDGKNDAGRNAASGVYIWYAKTDSSHKKGKIAIIR